MSALGVAIVSMAAMGFGALIAAAILLVARDESKSNATPEGTCPTCGSVPVIEFPANREAS